MLLRTPQILKKSGINNVCAEKQSAVRSCDAVGRRVHCLLSIFFDPKVCNLRTLFVQFTDSKHLRSLKEFKESQIAKFKECYKVLLKFKNS